MLRSQYSVFQYNISDMIGCLKLLRENLAITVQAIASFLGNKIYANIIIFKLTKETQIKEVKHAEKETLKTVIEVKHFVKNYL